MAIDAVVGIPGSGKSYFALDKAIQKWIKSYKRARAKHHTLLKIAGVYSDNPALNMPSRLHYQNLAANFDIHRQHLAHYLIIRKGLHWTEAVCLVADIETVHNYQNLIDVYNSVFICDEAQLWFNARDFALFPTEVLMFWTQHRKGGVDVLLVTQRYEMIDTNIRGLVANIFRARPLAWPLRLVRVLAGRLGLVDSSRPVFRYTSVQDEAEGHISNKSKGVMEGMSRNELVVLDPLLAQCYATATLFAAPTLELHEVNKTAKSRASAALGLKFDLSRFTRRKEQYQTPDCGLSIAELASCLRAGVSPSDVVMDATSRLEVGGLGAARSAHPETPTSSRHSDPLGDMWEMLL